MCQSYWNPPRLNRHNLNLSAASDPNQSNAIPAVSETKGEGGLAAAIDVDDDERKAGRSNIELDIDSCSCQVRTEIFVAGKRFRKPPLVTMFGKQELYRPIDEGGMVSIFRMVCCFLVTRGRRSREKMRSSYDWREKITRPPTLRDEPAKISHNLSLSSRGQNSTIAPSCVKALH